MGLKGQLEDKLFEMEKVAQLFQIEPFDIYFLGGTNRTDLFESKKQGFIDKLILFREKYNV